mmetsp:Transcript_11561/g.36607  ORF Transcript_11561/g.36607 Transcript_11561/m.36607 type:complete len:157 (-) Transcript_11561:163-633(-)
MCAVLSLRSVYTVTVLLIERFAYLQHAVALLLLFVGLKIVADVLLGVTLPTGASLCVIAATLGCGVLASVLSSAQPKGRRAYQPVGALDGGGGDAHGKGCGKGNGGGGHKGSGMCGRADPNSKLSQIKALVSHSAAAAAAAVLADSSATRLRATAA